MGELRQQLMDALLVRRLAAHQRREIQHHLLRQRAGQLFQLRIALFLTVLTEPRGALHQRDEQGETDKDNDRTMQPEFQFCANHIPPLKICSLMLPEALVTR